MEENELTRTIDLWICVEGDEVMELYVPCPCRGKESPCFACHETGKIGPLSIYEYEAFYKNKVKES